MRDVQIIVLINRSTNVVVVVEVDIEGENISVKDEPDLTTNEEVQRKNRED